MKREAPTSTKMRRLCRLLDVPLYHTVGMLELLWHLTAREAPQGNIGKLGDEDIALGIDWRGDPNVLIKALCDSRWLDDDHPDHRLLVHDWSEHSDDAVDVKLARNGRRYADGRQPRMNRLSAKERKKLCATFGWEADLCAQKATPCASVRTNAHEKPLPVPVPVPVPVPEPAPAPGANRGANGSGSPEAFNRAREHPPSPAAGFSSTKGDAIDIARAVMDETGLSSNYVFEALKAQALVELKENFPPGKSPPEEIKTGMVLAWNEFQRCVAAGKVKIDRSAEKFFSEGRWKDSKLWGLLKGETAWN